MQNAMNARAVGLSSRLWRTVVLLILGAVFSPVLIAGPAGAQSAQAAPSSSGEAIAIDGDFSDWALNPATYAPGHVPGPDSTRWSFTEPNPDSCAIDRWGSDAELDTIVQQGTFRPALAGRPSGFAQAYTQFSAASRHCFRVGDDAGPNTTLKLLHSLERLALPAGFGNSERKDISFSCSLFDGGDSGSAVENMACVRMINTRACAITDGCTVGVVTEIRLYRCANTSDTACVSPVLLSVDRTGPVGTHDYLNADTLGSPYSVFTWDQPGPSNVPLANGFAARQRDENIEFQIPQSALGFAPGETVCVSMFAGAVDWSDLSPRFDYPVDLIDDAQGNPRRVCDTLPAPVVISALMDGEPSAPVTGTPGARVVWSLEVPEDAATLKVSMAGFGDADLYVNYGSAPTLDTWRCRPYVDASSNEECTISEPAAGTWFVLVNGYASFSGTTVTASVLGAPSVLVDGVASAPVSGPRGSQVLWEIDVPIGAPSLKVTMNGVGDADMHLRFGSPATLDDYTCRPYLDATSDEECLIPNPVPGRWFVMANGFTEFSDLTITATTASPADPLFNGVRSAPVSGPAGSEASWAFDIPAGTSTLRVVMQGQGDADLYLRAGALASEQDWDCRPYLDGTSSELCTIANPAPGKWYVTARGYTQHSNTTIRATW